MPLRDFDQVRERIHLRVEVRHIAQGVSVVLVLVGAAFAGGVWYAKSAPPDVAQVAPPTPSNDARGLPPAAVAIAEAVSRTVEAPIYPKPALATAALHDVESPPVAVAPTEGVAPGPDEFAAAPGERAILPSEGNAPAEVVQPAAAPTPAPVVAKPEAAPVPPPIVAKPVVPAPPAPVVAKPVVAPAPAPVIAKPVVPAPPPVVAKLPAPAGLALFGTLRMAPTVALVSAVVTPVKPAPVAAPVVAPTEPPAHKPLVRQREDDVRPPPVTSHYVIQVKAFFNEQEAKAFESDLRGKGYAPKLTSTEDPGKGTIYRVRLGPFDRPEAARAVQKQFEAAEGHTTIILGVP